MCRIGIMPDILRIRDSLPHCQNRGLTRIQELPGLNPRYTHHLPNTHLDNFSIPSRQHSDRLGCYIFFSIL